jgi:CRP-like cAMP-binding protein
LSAAGPSSAHGSSSDELELLRSAVTSVRTIGPRQDILADGDTPSDAYLILEGWGVRCKDLAEGRRQVLDFLLPGDFCLNPPDKPVSHCVGSLTWLRYGVIPMAHLEAMMGSSPKFARVAWRKQLAANAVNLVWLANSGRPAYERISHLLCEIFARAQAAGLGDDRSCEFPPTQFDLACALGLTAVHVNRTLQHLRLDGLIELRGKRLVVLDSKGLGEAAQFDRSYLRRYES